ncbi:metal-sensitive transcriptional regulator [Corynebacterium guangdongense]|uniref:DNA-binding FrmR family transcriptional regulator n=1 Tax=Corynebacterium guangdongense TaxID=1783348 RepID=A0ABU1ZVM0_9CORY|nr:metal-sensitive transcriptional regulator [Corynebacterium guangdongense]MDR7328408.1 DNA-binding FrmR family transcriptional regulator [Corynebacterium guangdongense]WJZ16985.1 Copper-sensing transcriptional repressor CsoR [Corynebacterium guangdongense]
MKLDPEEMRPALMRLKRARGQLDAVIRMLEEGEECEDIVTQTSAVATAVQRAGFLVVSTGMRKCMVEQGPDSMDGQRLEKMLLKLA